MDGGGLPARAGRRVRGAGPFSGQDIQPVSNQRPGGEGAREEEWKMLEVRSRGDTLDPPVVPRVSGETQRLLEWLRTGKLTLIDPSRRPLALEAWAELPPHVQDQAVEDFRRVVSANAKAAVIFLRS
jgi:hypothetical protein